MKVEVIRLKKNPFNAQKQKMAIQNSLRGAAEGAKVDFLVTVQTWSFQPSFTIKVTSTYSQVSTKDQTYRYITYGTAAHFILPRRTRRLVFRGGSSPKTSPGVIRSRAGKVGSGPLIFRKSVRHPGVTPRLFHEVIQRKWEKQFPILAQKAVSDAVRTS